MFLFSNRLLGCNLLRKKIDETTVFHPSQSGKSDGPSAGSSKSLIFAPQLLLSFLPLEEKIFPSYSRPLLNWNINWVLNILSLFRCILNWKRRPFISKFAAGCDKISPGRPSFEEVLGGLRSLEERERRCCVRRSPPLPVSERPPHSP